MADVKIPNEEPGLVQKTKLPYAEVLELACAQAADLIHIPDINHYDGRPFSLFTRDDTLKAFAESGRTHIFLELMPKFQEHADALTGGTINTDQFVERLRKNNFQDIRLDKDEELKELADFIVKSHKLGMKVHFCNPANGTPENIVVEMSRRLQGKPAAEIQVHMDILARGLFQVESPLREQVTACLFRKTPAEVKDFWTKLENSPDEKLLETSKAEFEKVILALTTPEALKERLKAANLVRLSDDELALLRPVISPKVAS